jgi:ferritin-like metal-binding protein YciE
MAEPNARDAKLIQYLNEAYGKEKELETSLEAHISMTTKAPYKKRLQQHLKETKAHARTVERRIKQLGGKADTSSVPGPDAVGGATSAVTSLANRAVAAAKGPMHALRGTGEQEKMLKNAKSQYWNEFEEIATYKAIEALADAVGDKETAQLARGIRREEERMAKFLDGQITSLTKGVAREEIPAAERNGGSRRRSGGRSRSGSSGGSRASSSGGSRASASSRAGSGASKAPSSRASRSSSGSSGGSSRSSASKASRSSASRSKASRSSASRSTGSKSAAAKKLASKSSGSGSRSSAGKTLAKRSTGSGSSRSKRSSK